MSTMSESVLLDRSQIFLPSLLLPWNIDDRSWVVWSALWVSRTGIPPPVVGHLFFFDVVTPRLL